MIFCPRIAASEELDFPELDRLLAGAPRMAFTQGWQGKPDPDFLPASARFAWRPEGLVVLAELFDADIFNPCTTFNEFSYLQGDVFEMFLRPLPQEAYFELHVTPRNQHMQLRIPSGREFLARSGQPIAPEWFIADRQFPSRVRIEPDRWLVAAELPASFFGRRELHAGEQWLVSFSRYDYVRGREEPIYSSTSPHAQLSYHRQQEWARVRLT